MSSMMSQKSILVSLFSDLFVVAFFIVVCRANNLGTKCPRQEESHKNASEYFSLSSIKYLL